MEWKQDKSDFSWSATAPDGTLFVAKEVYVDVAKWRWVIVWSEQNGFRVGTRTYDSDEHAKSECEELVATTA